MARKVKFSCLLRAVFLSIVLFFAGCVSKDVAPPPEIKVTPLEPKVEPPQKKAGTIGVLLPLSGRFEMIGNSMQKAVHMAVFDYASDIIKIQVYDTGSTARGAERAAMQALSEGASVLVGPLTMEETHVVGRRALSKSVPVISFSNDLDALSENVFITGYLPEMEIDAVVNYASKRGLYHYVAFIPNNQFGHRAAQAFQYSVERNHDYLVGIVFYEPDGSDMAQAARQLIDLEPFDALLIGDYDHQRTILAAAYASSEITDPTEVQALGVSSWSVEGFGREVLLNGSWFADVNPVAREEFSLRYMDIYEEEPHRLALLAYSGIGYTSELLSMRVIKESDDVAGYVFRTGGADDFYSLQSNGTVERHLVIMEAGLGLPVVIEHEITKPIFQNYGFY